MKISKLKGIYDDNNETFQVQNTIENLFVMICNTTLSFCDMSN